MKLITILLFGLLSTGISNGQEKDDLYYTATNNTQNDVPKSIPKGVSKIIIHNKLNKADNFQLIGEKLTENNYQIDKVNKDFWTISTVAKSHEKLNFNYILNFIAKDSIIIITGTYKVNVSMSLYGVESQPSNWKIENKGMKGSGTKEAFQKMYIFATILSDISKLEFLIE
jgi:hypothetical protein